MNHDIHQQFLEFDNLGSQAVLSLPPPVGIEASVERRPDDHTCRLVPHCPSHNATNAARVIEGRDNNERTHVTLATPGRQCARFSPGASVAPLDHVDGLNAKLPEQLDGPHGFVFAQNPAANKFPRRRLFWLDENHDGGGHTAMN